MNIRDTHSISLPMNLRHLMVRGELGFAAPWYSYRPTTPNAQRSTPNVSMEAVRFEVLGVERSLVASSLLSISSLTVPRKPQLPEVSGQAFGRHDRGVAFG